MKFMSGKKLACRQCWAIRRFLFAAAILIISMPFLGGKIEALKTLTPIHFASGIFVFGVIAVVIKIFEYRAIKNKK
jgi:hypothetical protein